MQGGWSGALAPVGTCAEASLRAHFRTALWASNSMKTYVINMATSVDRRAFQRLQFDRLGLNFEIFEAVTPVDIADQDLILLAESWERVMSKGEVACFLSHRELWRKVANADAPALILEDDAMLSEHTPLVLSELADIENVDRVNLEVRIKRKIVDKRARELGSNHRLLGLYLDRSGAAGYVIWPSGARKLLAYFDRRAAIADKALRFADLTTYQVEPAVVVPADFCDAFGMHSPLQSPTTINPVKLRLRYSTVANVLRCKGRRLKTQLSDIRQYLRILSSAKKRRLRVSNEHFLHCTDRMRGAANPALSPEHCLAQIRQDQVLCDHQS